jgi:hypothetical protein
MSEQPVKQSRLAPVKNFVVKHQTKILVTATVASTAAAVVMRTGIKQHNDFLKEHGLYEQFYQITQEA